MKLGRLLCVASTVVFLSGWLVGPYYSYVGKSYLLNFGESGFYARMYLWIFGFLVGLVGLCLDRSLGTTRIIGWAGTLLNGLVVAAPAILSLLLVSH